MTAMKWKNSIFAKGYRFLKYCKYKPLCFVALLYSAYYRLGILLLKPARLQKHWGIRGEESTEEETTETYRYAYRVSYAVDRICNRTAWESKCLVRALTAQTLLKKKGIHSTLYLGCAVEEGKMVAHAWLRCGKMYVTGGDGSKYAMVDKYYS